MTLNLSPPPEMQKKPSKDKSWSGGGFIRFGMVCVLILGGGFGTWAATAKLSGAVIAGGALRVETNRQIVQHPDGGVVSEILVRDGDTVAAGDVLVRLDATHLSSQLHQLESQLYEIIARRGRLEAIEAGADEITFDEELIEAAKFNPDIARLMEGQRSLFHARNASMAKEREVMDERQLQLDEQIRGSKAEVAALVRQSELIGKELADMTRLLKQKLVPVSRVLALEREQARLQGESGQLIAQIARLKGQISEIDVELLRMEARILEESIAELRELGFRELEFKERRLSILEQLSRLEIRAPLSGTVLDNTVHALKSVIRPADPIMFIVPSDTKMVVDARVDPINRDQIFPGQEAVLRFSAFNMRTTPQIFGEIVNVSPDTVMDEQSGFIYYKSEVRIRESEFDKLDGLELVAGMPVEVYIQTGERTPINYMVKPIADYFNRAWRED